MTAPQIVATVFFLVSLSSGLALATRAAAAAALDALAQACRRARVPGSRSRGLAMTACLVRHDVRRRFDRL